MLTKEQMKKAIAHYEHFVASGGGKFTGVEVDVRRLRIRGRNVQKYVVCDVIINRYEENYQERFRDWEYHVEEVERIWRKMNGKK